MTNLNDREEKFTDAEFAALERNADGDIVEDLGLANIWMTEAQIAQLSGDDQTRVDGYQEEMRVMLAQLMEELG